MWFEPEWKDRLYKIGQTPLSLLALQLRHLGAGLNRKEGIEHFPEPGLDAGGHKLVSPVNIYGSVPSIPRSAAATAAAGSQRETRRAGIVREAYGPPPVVLERVHEVPIHAGVLREPAVLFVDQSMDLVQSCDREAGVHGDHAGRDRLRRQPVVEPDLAHHEIRDVFVGEVASQVDEVIQGPGHVEGHRVEVLGQTGLQPTAPHRVQKAV